jgi:hypothetical protein
VAIVAGGRLLAALARGGWRAAGAHARVEALQLRLVERPRRLRDALNSRQDTMQIDIQSMNHVESLALRCCSAAESRRSVVFLPMLMLAIFGVWILDGCCQQLAGLNELRTPFRPIACSRPLQFSVWHISAAEAPSSLPSHRLATCLCCTTRKRSKPTEMPQAIVWVSQRLENSEVVSCSWASAMMLFIRLGQDFHSE